MLLLGACQASQLPIDAGAEPTAPPPQVVKPAPQPTARALERQQLVEQEPPALGGTPNLVGLFKLPPNVPTSFDPKHLVVAEVSLPAAAFSPASEQSVSNLLLRPAGAEDDLLAVKVLFVDHDGRELSVRELEAPRGFVRGLYLFEAPGFVHGVVTWHRGEPGTSGRLSTKQLTIVPRPRRTEKAIALETLRPGRWALVTRFENADVPIGDLFLRMLDAAGEEPAFVRAWVLENGALLEPDDRSRGQAVYVFEATGFRPARLMFEEHEVPLPPARQVLSVRARAIASEVPAVP